MNNSNRDEHHRFLHEHFGITTRLGQFTVALAGNPNVGKSTVFNALTGLHQHTGNWPGKTVDNAQGNFTYLDHSFLMVDLPGTYSILAHTVEEQVARDFICFGKPDATLVVLDATCLERNLNLALQVMEITSKVIVCVNLMDEATKKNININIPALQKELGVPVIATAARNGVGLDKLRQGLYEMSIGSCIGTPRQIKYSPAVENAIQQLLPNITRVIGPNLNPRWVALRLLDGDQAFIKSITSYLGLSLIYLQEAAV
ncbi:FeoB small GTPase domain-containing protein [Pelosinus sp. IPA-1]|uniref:FeoB small GTPase domain-containing protein n=1 Tax=Pelosinus sp. IPA-1 TaxID=3029569 RepID=UPI0024362AE6|nr:FeoB small GTPase domain-containing protein [Pelosinus sp. IPA-1]GMA97678.1 iron transporter FeoB [Pelosinus sp. IPA-1]